MGGVSTDAFRSQTKKEQNGMNWEVVGTIAEIVGAIGVVISLVYLAVQVKSNTRALKANASFETTHSWAAFNEMLVSAMMSDSAFQAGEDCRVVEITAKFYNPHGRPEDLSQNDMVLVSMMHRALFQKLEGQYYQFKHGYLEPQIWIARRNWARGVLELPLGRAWWEQEVQAFIFSPEFVSIITDAPIASIKVKLPGVEE
jgi:hypothetical protein